MNFRRLISSFAIIGILLHAAFFVHHNAMMLGAALDRAALAEAFGEVCFGASGSTHASNSTLPQSPDSLQKHCPDCLAFTGAMAALPNSSPFYITFYSIASDTLISTGPVISVHLPLRPPSQGPPAIA